MTFKVVGTGSSGNCYLLCGRHETLVIETGVKFIEVKKALNFDLSSIVGCVCSHEHLDHAKYVSEFKNAGIPVLGCENIHPSKVVEPGKGYKVGGFRIMPLSVDHDCPCFAYIISHDEMGKMVFITDTMTFNYDIPGVNHLVIEANYDDDTLNQNVEMGLLDPSLRNRIVQSHLSLDTAIDTAKNIFNTHLYNLIYVHLSGGNSDVNTFIAKTRRQIGMTPIIAKKGLCIDL